MIYESEIQIESRNECRNEGINNNILPTIKDVPLKTNDLKGNVRIKEENEELSDCEFLSIKTEEVWFGSDCGNDNESSSDTDMTIEVSSSRDSPVCKKVKRKFENSWSDESILKLIHAVESRKCLWDVGSTEYKLGKDSAWQEVADAISVSLNDCIGKWNSLRTIFNMNLEKLNKKNSGQSTDEAVTTSWKYFKPMLFLESNKFCQSTQRTSSMQSESITTDDSNFTDLGFSDELCLASPSLCRQGRYRKSKTPTSPPSTSSRFNNELQLMYSRQSRQQDSSTAFAEYIAAELRSLTPEKAAYVKSKLRRVFNDIMDEVSLMVTQQH